MTDMQPPPDPPQPPPGYPPYVVAQPPPVSGAAVTSLVFGIIGALGGFCAFGIPCIIAVLAGHQALHDTIPKGSKTGRGMAIAGLILGYLFVIPAAILLITGGIGSLLDSSR